MAQTTATEKWIEENQWWITPDHEPLVEQLRGLAREMDTRTTSSLASAYRLTFKQLMEMKIRDDSPALPGAAGDGDPGAAEDPLLSPE